jgi:uncharacterized membrane protein
MEEEKRKEADDMKFKARTFRAEELQPNLPEFHRIAPTKGAAPKFASEERLQYRHEVLDPRKREREEAERAAHDAREAARLVSAPGASWTLLPAPTWPACFLDAWRSGWLAGRLARGLPDR